MAGTHQVDGIKRIVFMGTPEFSVPVLRRLVQAGYDVVAVVTQPDRPVGRDRKPVPTPVKKAAIELGIPVLQPERVRQPEFVEQLRQLRPDALVVAAFGQILPRSLLELAPYGAINVHASLLPDLRGASPIAEAIARGYDRTGVTIMMMDPGMDTGPILSQRAVAIEPEDTTESLSVRLAQVGADLLVETLPGWGRREIQPRAQDDASATVTRLLTKEAGHVDWTSAAERLERLCRAYYPWPGCYTAWDGKTLKLLKTWAEPDGASRGVPGDVVLWRSKRPEVKGEWPAVVTGQGLLVLERVQLEGKRPMTGQEFVRGSRGFVGAHLD